MRHSTVVIPERRLSRAALAVIPERARPRIDLGELRTGLLHLGLGGFARAHLAVYTEEAADPAFGVLGVTMRSMAAADLLRPQDWLYSVRTGGHDIRTGGHDIRVVGTLTGVVGPAAGIEAIADPAVQVITMTVTEPGYRHDPTTGRLRTEDPEVAADLAGRPPVTAVGRLVAGLVARRNADAGPVTVMCCDNLVGGGRLLSGLVDAYCDRRPHDRGLLGWIRENVAFPSSMVDRIVPIPSRADREAAARLLGVNDQAALATEPFRQWVIEDAFAAGRPAWERAGAIVTPDVVPYETMKLRMVNGAHSLLAYLGLLAGLETIGQAMARPQLAEAARLYLEQDAAPTLVAPPGVDLAAYSADLLRRLANPELRHPLDQVAADGTHKLPQRLIPVIRERLARGAEPRWAALGVAAWMRCVDSGTDAGEVVDRLLRTEGVFGSDLPGSPVLRGLLVDWVSRLVADGPLGSARG